ncbi:uncharacterized protein PGTG_02669 [Puccinia graminis f. sp. tritici CRL 75-36-700-3]|uniref:Uncharacterized protein n=1 Tax=Puccinia graminis f. sp. tritici (strain CRL 75-36-700-3 / race SCCL) TaxID=418459 RepID=E3JW03_PUCGT|nr:uncharacterized protein PGTG_02669 [Puccinia graminis f. sp. tritici CRL 75-36-700-3]EFP76228.1 hypothetical protein PGTG_02669 [Puccinia graminis f. sp. tritici CRL 75-36-700-3]
MAMGCSLGLRLLPLKLAQSACNLVSFAGETMHVFIGLMSQFWARKYWAHWFRKYNYILSAAVDGGTELVVFFLAIFFQGGDGHKINFPMYFLNPPSSTPRDYCYMGPDSCASES